MSSNPLNRGLRAGYSAYLDPYRNTGTSAAAYDYLMGEGAYPVTPVSSGLPVQRSYEEATGIVPPGTYKPVSQGEIAATAKGAPWRGTSPQPGSAVQMPQQSMLSQLTGMALPAYVGYKFLVPNPVKDSIASYLDMPSLAGTKAATTAAGQTGATGISAAAPVARPQPFLNVAAPTGDFTAAAAAPTTTGVASAAPTAGYVYDAASGSLVPASASEIAAANAGAGATGVGAVTGGGAGAAGAAEGAGAAAEGSGLGAWAMANPELAVAAALLSMTPGGQNIVGGLTNAVTSLVSDAGNLVSSGVKTVGNIVGDVAGGAVSGLRDITGGIAGALGFAEGGETHGLSDALHYRKGGDTEDDLLRPQFEPTNSLGQQLGGDLTTAYQKAVSRGQKKKAQTLKDELDYRARMQALQAPQQAAQHFNLGGYSDGGRLLKGPGDGVSDSIPATIGNNKQPARLADGEFVVPARIVSELGNGSTEAGARKLYAMMDRIQAGRKKSVGKGKVAVNSRADKHLPA